MDAFQKMARERAIEKIRKLLAMANDGRGNENEAAIAAAQAEKMMRHYQVEASDVVLEEIEHDEAFDRGLEDVSFEGLKGYKPKQVSSWVGYIAVGCGAAFTCRVDVVATPIGVKVRFSGYQMDVMLCRWVYRLLCETVFRISKEQTAGLGMSAAKSFRLGAGSRLQHRLYAIKSEREAEKQAAVPALENKSNALVLYDRKQQRVEEMYGATKTVNKRHTAGDRAAYHAGQAAAEKMHIPTNTPITGAKNHPKLN